MFYNSYVFLCIQLSPITYLGYVTVGCLPGKISFKGLSISIQGITESLSEPISTLVCFVAIGLNSIFRYIRCEWIITLAFKFLGLIFLGVTFSKGICRKK